MVLIQKEPQSIKICVEKSLCFTANTAGSTVRLNKFGSPTSVTLEISIDGITWSDYTVSTRITLTNVGDKVYFRNKYSTTYFSIDSNNYYYFQMTGSIAASGDVTSLLDKNGTDTLSSYCFYYLFNGCAALTTSPQLPATTLADYCYRSMFNVCTSLTALPKLPATTLPNYCYRGMFYGCSNIKLSTTQTGIYQTPYRIPTTGSGTIGTSSLEYMFAATGGSFTETPTINQTYYTSNTVVPATTYPVKDVQKVYIGSTQVRPSGWQPGANTVAYYPLKENVLDYSGNGNNATGNPNSFTGGVANYSGASTTLPTSLVNSASTPVTMSVWINAGTQDATVLGQHTTANRGFSLTYNHTNSSYRIVFTTDSGVGYATTYSVIYQGSALSGWHHVVGMRDLSKIYLYLDGQYVAESSQPGVASNNTFYLGYDHGYGGGAWNGKISELIFEDKIRTAQEIADYYNQTKSDYGIS